MKQFNAFQFVALFMALPFVMSWLRSEQFTGHNLAIVPAAIIYVVQAVMLTGMAYDAFEKW